MKILACDAFLVSLLLAGVGCSAKSPSAGVSSSEKIAVSVTKPERRTIGDRLTLSGALKPYEEVTLYGNIRGAAAQFRPNIDAMQEFKMEVSGYSAEYGKMAGGILNMVLKTGGNRLHGSLFEYVRNDKFDARAYFDTEKLGFHQNQFGATVTGPFNLGKLYSGRDQTFFLWSWESATAYPGARPSGGMCRRNSSGPAATNDRSASPRFGSSSRWRSARTWAGRCLRMSKSACWRA